MTIPLVTLRQMVRDRMGVPSHDTFFEPTIIDNNINLAVLTIEAEYRWPWSERSVDVTIDTTGSFAVPSDWRTTRAVLTELRELEEWTYYDLKWRYSENQSGSPVHWALLNKTIHVRPLPSSNIAATHIYYRSPSLLSADSDAPEIPAEHVGVIVAKAAQLCSVREDDRPSADSHLAEYMQGLERMRKDVKGSTRPGRTRVRAGSWL